MSLIAGNRLGPYEIVALIGEGGMGEVYKARDTRLERYVAIKVLSADKLANPERKRRFEQEARAASVLSHQGIVTIHDIGNENGVSYIAMEFVEGRTLAALMPKEGMRVRQALRYAVQAADALARAHSAGIVHRDLKPENIMITGEDQVKILDFGLAKLSQITEEETQTKTRTMGPQTEEGTIMGTPPYMSPEQAEGREVEGRSDIFSFGAVLYEMLTGHQAFRGDTRMSTLSAVMRDEPKAPASIREGITPELDRIVMRCLRKDPARRFQTAADLKVALQELEEELQSGILPAPVVKGQAVEGKVWLVWLLAALVPMCGLGGFLLGRRGGEVAPIGQSKPLTSYPGVEMHPSFSPDGNQVVFVWNGENQDNSDIYVKVVGAGAPLRLTTDPGLDFSPKWSPDGSRIAFLRRLPEGIGVFLIPALGGPERRLITHQDRARSGSFLMGTFQGLSWSPDSKYLAVAGGDAMTRKIHLVSVESGESRVLTNPPAASEGDAEPAFSPDGRALAFSRNPGVQVQEIWILPLNQSYEPAGEPRKLPVENQLAGAAAWSGDGSEIIFTSGLEQLASLYRIAADGKTPARRIEAMGDGVKEPAIGGAGRRLAFTRSIRNAVIWRLDTANGKVDQLIASSFREAAPQYSPDGKSIVFYSNRSGMNEIWMAKADGTGAAQITFLNATTTGTPRWSPDGQRISFDSNVSGKWQIYVMSASGGKASAVTSDNFNNVVSSWSRDGKWIYYTARRSGIEEIWKMPTEGGTAAQVTHGGGTGAFESKDGKTVYFVRTTQGKNWLWKMPVAGGEASRVAGPVYRFNYALGEAGIYFDSPSGEGSPSQIQFLDWKTGQVKTIHTLEKPVDLGLAVSPDGRYVLFAQRDLDRSDLMVVDNFH